MEQTTAENASSSSSVSESLDEHTLYTALIRAEQLTEDGFSGALLETDFPDLTPGKNVSVRVTAPSAVVFEITLQSVYAVEFAEMEENTLSAVAVRLSDEQPTESTASVAPLPDEKVSDELEGKLYGAFGNAFLPSHTAPGVEMELAEWLDRLAERSDLALLCAAYPGAPGGRLGNENATPVSFSRADTEELLTLLSEGLEKGETDGQICGQSWMLAAVDSTGNLLWSAQLDRGILTLVRPDGNGLTFGVDADCMNEIAERLWQIGQTGKTEQPGTSYRLLVNDPQAFSRYTVTTRLPTGAEELATWNSEWRACVLDDSMISTLYVSTPDELSREGSADEARELLQYAANAVAGYYTADPWEANSDFTFQLAAEGADGTVLWSFACNDSYAMFSPDGETAYCFRK